MIPSIIGLTALGLTAADKGLEGLQSFDVDKDKVDKFKKPVHGMSCFMIMASCICFMFNNSILGNAFKGNAK